MSTPKPPELYWKVRTYPEGKFVSLWLCRRDGAAHSGLLYGDVLPGVAEAIMGRLALPVERESSPLAGQGPVPRPGCAPLAKQADLFPDDKGG